jgi:predicted transposase/invertase (TIGR01784 family)
MQQVASLRYGVIFKKAFCDVEIFKAFVKDFLNIELEIDKVETEKTFDPPIGNINSRYDLFAEDKKNRIIVDIQHRHYEDHYDRFLHYHCAAILEQASTSRGYSPKRTVFTIVVSTSSSKEDCAIAEICFDPIDIFNKQPLNKIPHRVIFLAAKYANEQIPEPYRQWLMMIQDSLDEQIDESKYQKPEVLKIVNLIKRDGLTIDDRTRIIEEHALQEFIRQEKAEGFEEGLEKGVEKGLAKGEEKAKLEIAHKLQEQGLSLEMIEKVVGIKV